MTYISLPRHLLIIFAIINKPNDKKYTDLTGRDSYRSSIIFNLGFQCSCFRQQGQIHVTKYISKSSNAFKPFLTRLLIKSTQNIALPYCCLQYIFTFLPDFLSLTHNLW